MTSERKCEGCERLENEMSNRDEPAFPARLSFRGDEQLFAGMTKREYFAALAMQGLCADPNNHDIFSSIEHAAQNAVAIADALLAELERAK